MAMASVPSVSAWVVRWPCGRPPWRPDVVAAVGFYPAVPWERMSPEWPNYSGKSAMIHCSEEDGTSARSGIQQAKQAIEEAGGTRRRYSTTREPIMRSSTTTVRRLRRGRLGQAWQRTTSFLHDRLAG